MNVLLESATRAILSFLYRIYECRAAAHVTFRNELFQNPHT